MTHTNLPCISILLATYNGEHYLREQLDSIIRQTYPYWHLYVRDDGSTDSTLKILQDYFFLNPTRISLVQNSVVTDGPCHNFAELMCMVDGKYFMFCDQDDVWLPQKIEKTWEQMAALEKIFGAETPLLVHTDLTVVDSSLHTITCSVWNSLPLDVKNGILLNRLLVQNVITGCTMMINKPLLMLSIPVPSQAVMHDWWIALVASAMGRIGSVAEPTILYRQHRGNEMGAANVGFLSFVRRLYQGKEVGEFISCLQAQAAVFLKRYEAMLTPQQIEVLDVYSKLSALGFFKRRYSRVKYGFLYAGTIRNIGRLLLG